MGNKGGKTLLASKFSGLQVCPHMSISYSAMWQVLVHLREAQRGEMRNTVKNSSALNAEIISKMLLNYFPPKFNYLSEPGLCNAWHNSLSQI